MLNLRYFYVDYENNILFFYDPLVFHKIVWFSYSPGLSFVNRPVLFLCKLE